MFPTSVGMNRERYTGIRREGSIPHIRGDHPFNSIAGEHSLTLTGLSFLARFRSLFYQVSYDEPALRYFHDNFLHPFHPVMAGKERAMIDPAQESGNCRCIYFIQLKIGAELLHGDPLFDLSGLLHVLFKKFRNFLVACHEYSPDYEGGMCCGVLETVFLRASILSSPLHQVPFGGNLVAVLSFDPFDTVNTEGKSRNMFIHQSA